MTSLGLLALTSLAALGCSDAADPAMAKSPIETILESHAGLRPVVDRAQAYRLQAVLGTIEDGPDGRPRLVQHGFRLGAEYFYPASAVKLFAAVCALETLAALRQETGLAIDADTPLVYHPLFADEVLADADASNLEAGTISVRHEIRKLFLVSDNRAFNRLYELIGQDDLARCLARAGLGEARIVHRLSEARSIEDNRRVPRIDLVGDGFAYTLPARTAEPLPPAGEIGGLVVGQAQMQGGARVERGFDFATKNRISLADLQRGLCMVVRPELDCGGPGFALSPADRALLHEAMGQYPRQSKNPVYEAAAYPDHYVKYLLPGLVRAVPEARLRLLGKVGQAYGFTIDNAYAEDSASGRAFFLAAVIYTNADGVLNDDRYEYDQVALPLLTDLGEAAARYSWPR